MFCAGKVPVFRVSTSAVFLVRCALRWSLEGRLSEALRLKCFLKSMFTCFSSYCPLRLTAPSSAPPSPSCRLTPSSDFVSPYLICSPSQSVGLQPRGRCGRKPWCWRWQSLSWSTRRPQTCKVSRLHRDSRGPPASPSCWRPPSPTCTVGTHTSSYCFSVKIHDRRNQS